MPIPAALERHIGVSWFSTLLNAGMQCVENADGTASVKDLSIFKVGTFRDSMGIQHTWDPEHLQQMVFNYDLLKSRDIFPNVPVRADHSTSVDKVAGYMSALRTDGSQLYADYDFTEPDAYAKFKRGTYRSRSAEIGIYETNGDAVYWPVVWGFAFVDIPAAEGLHGVAHPNSKPFVLFDQEMPKMPDPVVPAAAHSTAPQIVVTFTNAGVPTAEPAAPVAPVAGVPAAVAPVAPVPGVPAPVAGPAMFRVNGVETNDFASVQALIDNYEKHTVTRREATRKGFVEGLVACGKLAQPAQADTEAFVLGLQTDEQFEAYSKTWANAPKLSLFAKHGDGPTGPSTPDADAVANEIDVCRAVLVSLRNSGMSEDDIAQTKHGKKLAALQAAK